MLEIVSELPTKLEELEFQWNQLDHFRMGASHLNGGQSLTFVPYEMTELADFVRLQDLNGTKFRPTDSLSMSRIQNSPVKDV